MVRTVIGRVNRPINSSTSLIAAGSGGQLANGTSVVRASSGTIIDQDGRIQSVGNDLPRVTNSTYVTTNYAPNPRMEGTSLGVVGVDGVYPDNFSIDNVLQAHEIVGYGSVNGIPYIDVHMYGVATNIAIRIRPFLTTPVQIAMDGGSTWTGSVYLQTLAGVTPPTEIRIVAPDETGTPIPVSNTLERYSRTRTIPATVTNGRIEIRQGFDIGEYYDYVLRIGGVQLEQASTVGPLVLPAEGTRGPASRYTGNRLLIEEPRTNYFYPQNFSVISQGTFTSVADPNGELLGQCFTANSVLTTHYTDRNVTTGIIAGTTHTFSVYLKAGSSKRINLYMYGTGNALLTTSFILEGEGSTNGDGTSAEYTSGGGTRQPSKITPCGNGWYRCSITGVPDTAAVNRRCRILVYDSTGTTTTFSGDDVTPTFYCAWPVLEDGGFATSFIPAPSGLTSRASEYGQLTLGSWFNYSTVTNLVKQSQQITSPWISSAALDLDSVVAPDGSSTADKITVPIGSTIAVYQTNIDVQPLMVYTASFFLLLGTIPQAEFVWTVRDDSNGQFIFVSEPVPTANTSTWTRQKKTFTTPAGCTNLRLYLLRSDISVGGTAFLWGAQVTLGASAGTYVPTTAAAVTATKPGPSTYVLRGMIPQQHPTAQMGLFAIDDTSFNNRLYAYVYPGTNDIFVVAITGGVQTIALNVGAHTPGSPLRLAVGYDENGVTASLNGAAAVTANGMVALWAFNRGILGDAYSGVIPMTGEVDAFTFYPYRVSGTQAQAMTT